jgi:hypothetical protein
VISESINQEKDGIREKRKVITLIVEDRHGGWQKARKESN